MTDITQVPNAKYFIEGLINLRGRINQLLIWQNFRNKAGRS